jgi:hypothetical protein
MRCERSRAKPVSAAKCAGTLGNPRARSSGDRALPCGGRGRKFESCRAHLCAGEPMVPPRAPSFIAPHGSLGVGLSPGRARLRPQSACRGLPDLAQPLRTIHARVNPWFPRGGPSSPLRMAPSGLGSRRAKPGLTRNARRAGYRIWLNRCWQSQLAVHAMTGVPSEPAGIPRATPRAARPTCPPRRRACCGLPPWSDQLVELHLQCLRVAVLVVLEEKTVRKVTIVVEVLITSCHVLLKPKNGPVTAHATTRPSAAMKAQ